MSKSGREGRSVEASGQAPVNQRIKVMGLGFRLGRVQGYLFVSAHRDHLSCRRRMTRDWTALACLMSRRDQGEEGEEEEEEEEEGEFCMQAHTHTDGQHSLSVLVSISPAQISAPFSRGSCLA
jgi:hypothetical protein